MPLFDDHDDFLDAMHAVPTRRAAESLHSAGLHWLAETYRHPVESEGEEPLLLVVLGVDASDYVEAWAVPVASLDAAAAEALQAMKGQRVRLALDGLSPSERAGALWLLVGSGDTDALQGLPELAEGTGVDLTSLKASFRAFEPYGVRRSVPGRFVAVCAATLCT